MLEADPRTSYMLGRCYTSKPHPQVPAAILTKTFHIRSGMGFSTCAMTALKKFCYLEHFIFHIRDAYLVYYEMY
jgi:hypothetical protein